LAGREKRGRRAYAAQPRLQRRFRPSTNEPDIKVYLERDGNGSHCHREGQGLVTDNPHWLLVTQIPSTLRKRQRPGDLIFGYENGMRRCVLIGDEGPQQSTRWQKRLDDRTTGTALPARKKRDLSRLGAPGYSLSSQDPKAKGGRRTAHQFQGIGTTANQLSRVKGS